MRLLVIVLALASLSSCTTNRVQKHTLVPAIQLAWPGVRADASVGGMSEGQLVVWDDAVETAELRGMDVIELEDACLAGIDVRLMAGEIGPQGAEIMRDRAHSFRAAVEEYTRVAKRLPRDNERLTVISRSSWKTSPPQAIAARTYR